MKKPYIKMVDRGPEPVFNAVTADGQEAVLINIYSQPDGSTLDPEEDGPAISVNVPMSPLIG